MSLPLKNDGFRQYEREQKAAAMKELLTPVIGSLNAMSGQASDALALAVMQEHPTLAGQLARGVALGIMRSVMRDPDWKPYDRTTEVQQCPSERYHGAQFSHPVHDGRFSCELVVGAELMARQGFV